MDALLAKRFGKALVELRNKREMTQQELAFECQLDRTYISLLERGLRQPSLGTIFGISGALEIRPSKLIAATEECN